MNRVLLVIAIVCGFGLFSLGQVYDGGFEAGAGSGYWTEISSNYNTPLCNDNCGNCGGECYPKDGEWYAWFGGSLGVAETGTLIQDIYLPSGGSAYLEMAVKIATPGEGLLEDRLEISIDSNIVKTITALDSVVYESYSQVSIDISSYLGGSSELKIQGIQSTDSVFNILVDNVRLIIDGQLSIDLMEELTESFTVYPNPAKSSFTTRFSDYEGKVKLRLLSSDGKLVSEEILNDVSGKEFLYNTSGLDTGLYFLEVEYENAVKVEHISIIQ